MMQEGEHLESLVTEYLELLQHGSEAEDTSLIDDPKNLIRALSKHAEWSEQGANELLHLATAYGAFILRNALAVAIALGKEDGDLGF